MSRLQIIQSPRIYAISVGALPLRRSCAAGRNVKPTAMIAPKSGTSSATSTYSCFPYIAYTVESPAQIPRDWGLKRATYSQVSDDFSRTPAMIGGRFGVGHDRRERLAPTENYPDYQRISPRKLESIGKIITIVKAAAGVIANPLIIPDR